MTTARQPALRHAYDAFATELKFMIDSPLAADIRAWARAELQPDPHGSGGRDDGYTTTSLYFDTPELDVYFRRRSNGRAKFRIRNYNGAPTVFLERKLKVGDRVSKRRSQAAPEDLLRIDDPLDNAWEGSWFARRVQHRGLRPVCQITYDRTARIGQSPDGPMRLTIDESVAAAVIDSPAFVAERGGELLWGRSILELKYRDHVPVLFKRLIEEFGLSPRKASKYRLAIEVLGLAGAAIGADAEESLVRHG